jgi:hypothetical protein
MVMLLLAWRISDCTVFTSSFSARRVENVCRNPFRTTHYFIRILIEFEGQRDLDFAAQMRSAVAPGVFYSRGIRENVMKIVPVIKCSELRRSLHFYTEVLDFERKWIGHEDREMSNGVIDLIREGAELQLSHHSGDGVFGSVNRVFVDDVDERYVTFRTRGLNTTQRPESPIHTAPVDQTWGLR